MKVRFLPKGGFQETGGFIELEDGEDAESDRPVYQRQGALTLRLICRDMKLSSTRTVRRGAPLDTDQDSEFYSPASRGISATGWIMPADDLGRYELSFLGHRKSHRKMSISIRETSGEEEVCASGYIDRGEFDTRNEENFFVEAALTPERFEELLSELAGDTQLEMTVALSRFPRFYATWSPSIDEGRLVKFLDRREDVENAGEAPEEFWNEEFYDEIVRKRDVQPPIEIRVIRALRTNAMDAKDVPGLVEADPDLEDSHNRLIERELRLYEDSNDTRSVRHSQYSRLLHDLAEAAADYAANCDLSSKEAKRVSFYEAIDVLSSLRWALVQEPKEISDKEWDKVENELNFWKHDRFPVEKIRSKNIPHMDKSQIEEAVSRYLELPYRARSLDRLFVDVLVALEFYTFGDEMLNEETFGIFPARSPLMQKHILLKYIFGQLGNGILFLGPAAFSLYSGSVGWISEGWALGIALILGAIFLLLLTIGTIALPFAWRSQFSARRKVAELITEMSSLYRELGSSGVLSAPYVRERASYTASLGVVWPGSLFALLDDVINRSGRL